jgi:hypothetical protein
MRIPIEYSTSLEVVLITHYSRERDRLRKVLEKYKLPFTERYIRGGRFPAVQSGQFYYPTIDSVSMLARSLQCNFMRGD